MYVVKSRHRMWSSLLIFNSHSRNVKPNQAVRGPLQGCTPEEEGSEGSRQGGPSKAEASLHTERV